MQMPPQFWFRTPLFRIDPREDEETNPFCYGKELAEWVKARFTALGYAPEDAIAEDWGWCVMLQRKPFLLWVGCCNMRTDLYRQVTPEQKDAFVPDGSTFVWTCTVGADIPIWTEFFWRKLLGKANADEDLRLVGRQLEQMLRSEAAIELVEQP